MTTKQRDLTLERAQHAWREANRNRLRLNGTVATQLNADAWYAGRPVVSR
jgi:hypothetical protein